MATFGSLFEPDQDRVLYFNKYGQFFGFLYMAMHGLGYLMLTWTTVVLLGGFVSALQKKDFWCLTFITFVEIIWIVDTTMVIGSVKNPASGLMAGVYWGVIGADDRLLQSNNLASIARLFLALLLVVLHLVLLWVILCPLSIIHVFGVTISGGISLWRLIEHDYGGDGQAPNMDPAIATLYYLAVLQGFVHCYTVIFLTISPRMAKAVAAVECSDQEMQVLTKYLKETMMKCRNDPSLVDQRNLITQALDKIGSRSIVTCVSGVEILYTAISIAERKVKHQQKNCSSTEESYLFNEDDGILALHNMMMKHLILSASSGHTLQKLLEMPGSGAPHAPETRQQAATIVDRLALGIDLEQFPRGIQHISSLIGMFQPYHRDSLHDEFEQRWVLQYCRRFPSRRGCAQDYGAYKELLMQGLFIFRKLATNRNNCRVMSDTPDLVSNIMVPITSDLLHNTPDDHGACSDVVMKSLQVMGQLVVAPGEIGAKLRHEISSSKEAVSTLQRIFSCNKCSEELQQNAIQILTRLYMDSECNRRGLVSTLVDVFTQDTEYSSAIKGYAGCALSQICFHGDAKIVLQTGGGDIVDSLIKVLIHEKNKVCRQAAAEILEHLCTHYTKDDDDDDESLGKAITNAMSQILGEKLCWGDETHNEKEDDQNGFPKPVTDIESQSEDNCKDKGNISPSLSHPQNNEPGEDEKESVNSTTLLSSLLSFCGTVYDMSFISDLPLQWDTSRLLSKLKQMVVSENEIDRPMVENLLLCKAIGKMVISMMNHSGSRFVKQWDLESFIEALSSVSKKMQNIDCYMAFRSTTASSRLNRRTLASFVKEAQEVYAMLPCTSLSGRSTTS